jgi:hypothetical protein
MQARVEKTIHLSIPSAEAHQMISELTQTVLKRLTPDDRERCPLFMEMASRLDDSLAED